MASSPRRASAVVFSFKRTTKSQVDRRRTQLEKRPDEDYERSEVNAEFLLQVILRVEEVSRHHHDVNERHLRR